MYERDRDRDVAAAHLMGAQEAATYLGIHRATLFRALSNGMIVADFTTPMGRARFRQETVDAFKEKLKSQAATSHQHVDAPVRVLAKLAGLYSGSLPSTKSLAVIAEVTQSLRPPVGSFDMVCVAIRVPDERDPFAMRLLAEQGFPERLKAAYECLRPCEEFPVTIAMRTGAPEVCDDLSRHPYPLASAQRALAQNGVASYAVFPLATGSGASREVIGALVLCAHAPHKFTRQEKLYLSGVADALSACIMRNALRDHLIQTQDTRSLTPEAALATASKLLETAYAQARRSRVETLPASGIAALCNLFAERSQALATWVYGFPPEACGDTSSAAPESETLRQYRSNLKSLVWQTRAADGLKCEQWGSEVTAVALPVPLSPSERGAVGAVWRGKRDEVVAEEILLSTLASACSVVSQYTVMNTAVRSNYSRKRA